MPQTSSDDAKFWDIVRNDPAFRARFYGRVHPLQESNGGVEFHNPENLRVMLQQAMTEAAAQPKGGMSAWAARQNRVAVIEQWLLQVQWVYEHILLVPAQLD
jgi:hypothetical protein